MLIAMVFTRGQRAQAMTEFALILALVAVVAISGLLLFGGTVGSMMSSLGSKVAFNL